MIETRARVLWSSKGRMRVRVEDRPGGCGRCDEPGGCRSVRLTEALGGPTEEFELSNAVNARQGDEVWIRIQSGAPLRAAIASYGLGALLLLIGAGLGHYLAGVGHEDATALAGGLAGLVIAIGMNRLLQRSRNWRHGLAVEIVPAEQACRHERDLAA